MADRLDYYFRQKVTEAELDLGFELLEKADRDLAADIGVRGIVQGAVPTPHLPVPDLTLDLTAPTTGYDQLGQRIFVGTSQRVDCEVDSTGLPTDVPVAGQVRWLGVFLRFDRQLSDPRTDGHSQQVFFRRDESFEFVVRQAPPAVPESAERVPLRPDELLVCDVVRRPGQTQILEDDIETSRRETFIFANGEAIEVLSGTWTTVHPEVPTVQSSLDAVDAELTGHVTGELHRHAASAIDVSPHGFLTSTHAEGALHEIVDALSSTSAGTPGAQKIGADSVPGTPHALGPATVDHQLSQILAWLNEHVGAISGAHPASSVEATLHHGLEGLNVQAQLEQILEALASVDAGSSGSTRVGSERVLGKPFGIVAGSVRSQIEALFESLNSHAKGDAGQHDASDITLESPSTQWDASDVAAALSEMFTAFETGHFRDNEASAGLHKTIYQPILPGSKALLWDARGVGTAAARFRVYGDTSSIWLTLNAAWDGAQWSRDIGLFCGGIHFSRHYFEIVHDDSLADTFTDWSHAWRLPISTSVNTGFEITGEVREEGRLGVEWTNTGAAMQLMTGGGAVTFRSRFPATPSSITLVETSSHILDTPSLNTPDRDGFGFYELHAVAAGGMVWWYGRYIAIT